MRVTDSPLSLRQALRRLAALAARRPLALIAIACAPFLLLSVLAVGTPVDLSFAGIMNREDPEVDRFFRLSDRYALGGDLLILLEGPEEALDEAAEELTLALSGHESVRMVADAVPRAWLSRQAPWLVDREVLDRWLAIVADPALALADPAALADLQGGVGGARDGADDVFHGRRLLFLRLDQMPLEDTLGDPAFFAVEARALAALRAHPEVSLAFSGLPVIAAQDQARTLASIRRLSPLSVLLVALLFTRVERRWYGILAVLLPLALAVTATLGLLGALLGKITMMETFFGVTILGLGIDFAVHLLVRQGEERGRGRDFEDALATTLHGTGRGVVAGALTTVGAFFVVAAAPDPVARHLGLSGGFGLLFCLILMLTVLPAAWALFERGSRRVASPPPALAPRLPPPVILLPARWAVSSPRFCLAVTGIAVVVSLAGASRFHVETDLQKVFNRQVPAVATVRTIQDLFGINTAPWIMTAESLEDARRLTARIEAEDRFSSAESAASFLPADAAERHAALLAAAPVVTARLRALPLLGAGGVLSSAQIAAPARALEVLQVAAEVGPPALAGLPESLRRRLLAPDGTLLVFAYPANSTFDATAAAADREVAQSIDPEAIGLGTLLESMMATERPWVWPVLAGIVTLVAVVLAVDLRDARDATLALVPVLVGTLATFGALCWAGIGFNVMTSLVVPLLIGLGVDDGIHVVHRLREDIGEPADHAAAHVGRAILMTTATSCASFSILLFTDHAGLESMAYVMLVGLPLALLASVTTLPALATLWPPTRR